MKASSLTFLSTSLVTLSTTMAFLNPNAVTSRTSIQEDLPFNPNTLFKGQISDQCCTDAASKMKQVMVPVSEDVSETGFVEISFIHWPKKIIPGSDATLPLLLVHGFMSSSLEYRLLAPLLSEAGVDVYCVDLLGWGYTQLDSVKSFSASAKVEALKGFWQTVGLNQDVVVGGAFVVTGKVHGESVRGHVTHHRVGAEDDVTADIDAERRSHPLRLHPRDCAGRLRTTVDGAAGRRTFYAASLTVGTPRVLLGGRREDRDRTNRPLGHGVAALPWRPEHTVDHPRPRGSQRDSSAQRENNRLTSGVGGWQGLLSL